MTQKLAVVWWSYRTHNYQYKEIWTQRNWFNFMNSSFKWVNFVIFLLCECSADCIQQSEWWTWLFPYKNSTWTCSKITCHHMWTRVITCEHVWLHVLSHVITCDFGTCSCGIFVRVTSLAVSFGHKIRSFFVPLAFSAPTSLISKQYNLNCFLCLCSIWKVWGLSELSL